MLLSTVVLAAALLSAGNDTPVGGSSPPTPFEAAKGAVTRNDRADLERMLLRGDVGVDARDGNSRTLLMFAVGKGSLACVTLLLENGANPNATDTDGRSVLMYGITRHGHDVVPMLLNAGSDVTVRDRQGYSAEALARLSARRRFTVSLPWMDTYFLFSLPLQEDPQFIRLAEMIVATKS